MQLLEEIFKRVTGEKELQKSIEKLVKEGVLGGADDEEILKVLEKTEREEAFEEDIDEETLEKQREEKEDKGKEKEEIVGESPSPVMIRNYHVSMDRLKKVCRERDAKSGGKTNFTSMFEKLKGMVTVDPALKPVRNIMKIVVDKLNERFGTGQTASPTLTSQLILSERKDRKITASIVTELNIGGLGAAVLAAILDTTKGEKMVAGIAQQTVEAVIALRGEKAKKLAEWLKANKQTLMQEKRVTKSWGALIFRLWDRFEEIESRILEDVKEEARREIIGKVQTAIAKWSGEQPSKTGKRRKGPIPMASREGAVTIAAMMGKPTEPLEALKMLLGLVSERGVAPVEIKVRNLWSKNVECKIRFTVDPRPIHQATVERWKTFWEEGVEGG